MAIETLLRRKIGHGTPQALPPNVIVPIEARHLDEAASQLERVRAALAAKDAEIKRLRKAIGDFLTSGEHPSAILALQRVYERRQQDIPSIYDPPKPDEIEWVDTAEQSSDSKP